MIGGLGADTLNAATGSTSTGDLMIGSWTDHDNNLQALQAIALNGLREELWINGSIALRTCFRRSEWFVHHVQ